MSQCADTSQGAAPAPVSDPPEISCRRNNGSILLTSVVGSYPQPDWLVDKDALRGQYVPRVPSEKIWRIPRELREEAIRDATVLAIRDMESAGIDVITDGEVAR